MSSSFDFFSGGPSVFLLEEESTLGLLDEVEEAEPAPTCCANRGSRLRFPSPLPLEPRCGERDRDRFGSATDFDDETEGTDNVETAVEEEAGPTGDPDRARFSFGDRLIFSIATSPLSSPPLPPSRGR